MNQQLSDYAARARDQYGFWLAPGPGLLGDQLHVHVPAGTDPDGSPLTLARPATRQEIVLWQQGRLAELARHLQGEVPAVRLPPPQELPRGTWQSFLAKLKAVARLGRRKP